jgi:hypothetical protein
MTDAEQTELFCEAMAVIWDRLTKLSESPALSRAGLPAEHVSCIRGIIRGEAQRAFRLYCTNKESLINERNNSRCVDPANCQHD